MGFEDLKSRIKAKGKPTSPEGWKRLLDVFTDFWIPTVHVGNASIYVGREIKSVFTRPKDVDVYDW